MNPKEYLDVPDLESSLNKKLLEENYILIINYQNYIRDQEVTYLITQAVAGQ